MLVTFLRKQPFIRLVLPTIAGILTQYYFGLELILSAFFLALCFLVFLLIYIKQKKYHTHSIYGFIILLLFYFTGIFITALQANSLNTIKSNQNIFIAIVNNVPKEQNTFYSCELSVNAVCDNNIWYEQDFKLMAYLEKDTIVRDLKAGQEIIFNAQLSEIKGQKNPFDFDYKKYLKLKQVNESTYLSGNKWMIIGKKEKGFRQKALNIRQKLIGLYEQAGIEGDQLAVFSALTLGYKDKLDARVKQAYSGAGAMHVLAVSGLHVGIVLIVLKWLFAFFNFFKKREKLKYLLIIVCLWGYALLTGMSVSVFRSTLMFSFLLLGYLFNKNIKIYNSLAASALILLFINPMSLFDVGFQLSYTAVAGIVFFYPKINKLVYIPNKHLQKIWSLTAVSIAAQLSTFPITTYYFGQFSTYFWLSNIVVSLGAALMLFSSFLLVLVSPFAIVFNFIGKSLNLLIEGINTFVFWVNDLPFAVVTGINIDLILLFLFYSCIALVSAWIILKRYNLLISSLVCILSIIIYKNISYMQKSGQTAVCIYHLTRASALQFIANDKAYWICKSQSEIDPNFYKKANLYWKNKDCNSVNKLTMDSIYAKENVLIKNNFLGFSKYKGLVIDENSNYLFLGKKDTILLDFILIRGAPVIKATDLPKSLQCKTLVIDGSVPPWKVNNWINAKNGYMHYTKEHGAFILVDN